MCALSIDTFINTLFFNNNTGPPIPTISGHLCPAQIPALKTCQPTLRNQAGMYIMSLASNVNIILKTIHYANIPIIPLK